MGSEQSSSQNHSFWTRTNTDHIPSDDDVIAVKLILNSYLPVEIIDDILDFAQYWARIRERRRIETGAETVPTGEAFPKAEWCYLVSPPIPQDAQVRLVKFVIESCDQGFGGEPEHRGMFAAYRITSSNLTIAYQQGLTRGHGHGLRQQ